MANILAVGIATLDIINTVQQFPQEDAEVRALSQHQSRGGNATNTLSILSQLGHHCAWAGVLIDEPDSIVIKQDLAKHHINISNCSVLKYGKMPTSYITLNQQTGSRTIVHHRDCPEFDFAQFKQIDLQHYDWLHFEGRNISETCMMVKYYKQQYPQLPCSIEIEKPRDGIEQLFELADILLFSKHYAESKGFENATAFLESLSINVTASCAWGELGAWLKTADKQIIHSPAFSPKQLIDTLGAGDTFNAGMIHSFLSNHNEQQAINYACQLAGHKCGHPGLTLSQLEFN